MQTDPAATSRRVLEAAKRQRAELQESMAALEQALAAPATGRAAQWTERVHVALVELESDLREHMQSTEEPGGLHAGLLAAAPRLAGPVARLARDHVRLRDAVHDLCNLTGEPGTADSVPEVRTHGTALLSELARHRQRGSDLVWEAYEVDIGGEM